MSHRLATQSARDQAASTTRLTIAETILRMDEMAKRNGHNPLYRLAQIHNVLESIIQAETEFLNEG